MATLALWPTRRRLSVRKELTLLLTGPPMAATFSRTLRELETEKGQSWPSVLLLVAVLVAWVLWFVLGRVSVYEITDKARLEVANRVHDVSAPVGGRIVETRLALGQDVAAGEVIVVLDSEAEQLAVAEKRGRPRRFPSS